MNILYATVAVSLMVVFISCSNDVQTINVLDQDLENAISASSPTGDYGYYILPSENDLAAIPQDPRNPLTPEKVKLGSFLFFETGIGTVPANAVGMQSYSCSSCHIPEADFKPGRSQGIGEGGFGFGLNGESRVKHQEYDELDMDVQGIRPLTVMNVAFAAENTLWNGSFGSGGSNVGTEEFWGTIDEATELNHLGFQGLETQNIEGLDVHRMFVDEQVASDLGYKEYYDAAFPELDPEEDRYSNFSTAMAISAYLRTIVTTEAPFQRWLQGDKNALTDQQKRGAILLFTDANCTSCHTSPAFNSPTFYGLGVNDLDMQVSFQETEKNKKKNLGRGGFTGRDSDMFHFKVPTLYNLQSTPFYFHGSSKTDLRSVVEYFNEAVPENPNVPASQIAQEFRPLNLTDNEIDDLTAFLRDGLQDPNPARYKPTNLPSGNCFPNADWKSMRDIGCN